MSTYHLTDSKTGALVCVFSSNSASEAVTTDAVLDPTHTYTLAPQRRIEGKVISWGSKVKIDGREFTALDVMQGDW